MDTLPQSSAIQSPSQVPTVTPSGAFAKESEVIHAAAAEANPIISTTPEAPLTPEVTHAGVRMQPDSIELPKIVQQLGVNVVTQAPAPATVPTIVLPLTDEQIAQGLHQSITSSFRWLAEWCERRLKEFHFVVRSIGKKAVREKI